MNCFVLGSFGARLFEALSKLRCVSSHRSPPPPLLSFFFSQGFLFLFLFLLFFVSDIFWTKLKTLQRGEEFLATQHFLGIQLPDSLSALFFTSKNSLRISFLVLLPCSFYFCVAWHADGIDIAMEMRCMASHWQLPAFPPLPSSG